MGRVGLGAVLAGTMRMSGIRETDCERGGGDDGYLWVWVEEEKEHGVGVLCPGVV